MAHFKSERHFQTAICNLALVNGWLVYNHPDSRKANVASTPGFPDIVLAKPGVLVFIETKMPKRHPSEDQQRWIDALKTAFIRCFVAYPDDYEMVRSIILGGK